MASVNISKWDIAQAFGLKHPHTVEIEGKWGDIETVFEFDFYGKTFHIDYYQSSYADACEKAAEQVLDMIAKAVVAMGEK